MPRPVRWGIIGAGGVARRQMLPAVAGHPEVELRAVATRDLARSRAIAAEFGVAAAFDSPEALLADETVEAVYLATPPARHAAQAIAAAEAGKHVLVEKPMALDPAECDAMIAAAASAGVRLGVCLPMRLDGRTAALRRWLDTGAAGDLVQIRLALSKWYPLEAAAWRADPAQSGGGVLMDLGSHLLDAVWYLGGPASAVTASLSNSAWAVPVEDTASVLLSLASGAQAICQISFATSSDVDELEIHGTRGSAVGRRGILWLAGEEVPVQAVNVHRAGLLDFGRALRSGEPSYATAADGRRNVAWLSAAYAAARGRVWASLD